MFESLLWTHNYPALVRVASANVRCARNDLASVGAFLVCDIIDGESVFIVAVANLDHSQ